MKTVPSSLFLLCKVCVRFSRFAPYSGEKTMFESKFPFLNT